MRNRIDLFPFGPAFRLMNPLPLGISGLFYLVMNKVVNVPDQLAMRRQLWRLPGKVFDILKDTAIVKLLIGILG